MFSLIDLIYELIASTLKAVDGCLFLGAAKQHYSLAVKLNVNGKQTKRGERNGPHDEALVALWWAKNQGGNGC